MTTTYNHDVDVSGYAVLGNVASGNATITITGSGAYSVTVSGLNLAGAGEAYPQAIAMSSVPGSAVQEVGVTGVSAPWTSFSITIHRTTAVDTTVMWWIIRAP